MLSRMRKEPRTAQVVARPRLRDFLTPGQIRTLDYGTPADRQVHVDVKSKTSGNVWRIYMHGSVTSNVMLVKLANPNRPPMAHGAWVGVGGRVCVNSQTYQNGIGWDDEAIELCYIAQVLGFTYDEEAICAMAYL